MCLTRQRYEPSPHRVNRANDTSDTGSAVDACSGDVSSDMSCHRTTGAGSNDVDLAHSDAALGLAVGLGEVKSVAAVLSVVRGRGYLFPLAVLVLYEAGLLLWGEIRAEHIAILVLFFVLALVGPKCRQFVFDVSPFVLLAVGYDSVRYAQSAIVRPDGVLGCGLRAFELRLFPFPFADGLTFPEWFAQHHNAVLDVVAAVPYFGQVYFAFLYAAFLFFVDRPRMRRFLWALAIANYIAFAMYVFLPAAPPWYIYERGCVIDLSAATSPAGLVRVDELLGIGYFTSYYSRAASVFGAMPSMHCAFPLIGMLTAWRSITWKTRWIHLLYTIVMFFAAIYLTHHWIVDAVAGWTVAATGVAIMAGFRLLRRRFALGRTAVHS